jgi:deazaflavin-dependent oxidoreductase (nitroreductase family)
MIDDLNEFNRQIMEEFRANGGQCGGSFAGVPLVIVHHTGAMSGVVRHAPLSYLPNGDDVVIFASKGGQPTNPDWYHNLIANPDTQIELGADIVPVHVREATGTERDELFDRQKTASPVFAEYEAATTRVIPVLVLEPR